MRLLYIILVFVFAWHITNAHDTDEDEKKTKTDAMLFGDVRAGDEHIPFARITSYNVCYTKLLRHPSRSWQRS